MALTEANQKEIGISTALIGVAAALFAVVFGVLALIAPVVSPGGQTALFVMSALSSLCLLVSILFGGRGMVLGPGRADFLDRFNLQAVFGGLAILLIIGMVATAFISPLEPTVSTEDEAISNLNARLEVIESELVRLEEEIDAVGGAASSATIDIEALDVRITEIEQLLQSQPLEPLQVE